MYVFVERAAEVAGLYGAVERVLISPLPVKPGGL